MRPGTETYKTIVTVFFTAALSMAVSRMNAIINECENIDKTIPWFLFSYFVISKFRYFWGDMKMHDYMMLNSQEGENNDNNIIVFMFTIVAFVLILFTAANIENTRYFIIFSILALLSFVFTLSIEKCKACKFNKDKRLPYCKWIGINIVEIGVFSVMYYVFYCGRCSDIKSDDGRNIFIALFCMLLLTFIADVGFISRNFLFDGNGCHSRPRSVPSERKSSGENFGKEDLSNQSNKNATYNINVSIMTDQG